MRAFWSRVEQGLAILKDRRAYLRRVAALQATGWVCRLLSAIAFLRAFHVDATLRNGLLVLVIGSLATGMPLTPGGLGPKQALTVAVLSSQGSHTKLLAFSVGMEMAILLVNVLPPLLSEVSAGMMAALLGMAVVLTLPFGYALDQMLGRQRSPRQVLFVGVTTYFGLATAAYVSGGLILFLMPSRPAFASADFGLVLILAGLMALIHSVVAYGLHRRSRAGQIGALALATGGVIVAVLLLRSQPTWAGAALALNAALIVATISLEP